MGADRAHWVAMAVTPLEPNDPQRLGDFVLTGRLGAGGMGVVYLGEDTGGEPVAVKLVRTDLAHDETFRERFRREVEALRRVSGPRVAALVAADTEAAQPYLVVEYVDGPTLAAPSTDPACAPWRPRWPRPSSSSTRWG